MLLALVADLREDLPRLGTRKLPRLLLPRLLLPRLLLPRLLLPRLLLPRLLLPRLLLPRLLLPRLLLPRLGEYAPQMGRDYLFALPVGHGLLIRRRKRRVVTTHICLPLFWRPNLIEHLTLSWAEQIWLSDITYVRLLSGWSCLSLITDLYSHKIVGACLHTDLV